VDRVSPRAVLVAGGLISTGRHGWLAPSMRYFRPHEDRGPALVGIFTAAPALLIATTEGQRESRR
jgi:hypothetical protein